MKLFCKALICALVVSILIGTIPFENSCKELSEDVFRIHIVANSDSALDQSVKLTVRDRVLETVSPLYRGVRSKKDAQRVTREHLPLIVSAANSALRASGVDYGARAELCRMYFNTRRYEHFTMPAGQYDALRLTLGEGRGQNFWCVMYPSLCVGAASEQEMEDKLDDGEYRVVTSDQVEYRFKVVEVFEKIRSYFA